MATNERIIALAGNPNVGKSTLFNRLTGMNQHTGNWSGKTVTNALGRFSADGADYILVDIPGTYSLISHSAEEEVARNFICFSDHDGVAVVCDASCLERNLNLVLQIMEVCPHTLVCINLMDEAKRKQIKIDLASLSEKLCAPVIGMVAHKKGAEQKFIDGLKIMLEKTDCQRLKINYPEPIEREIGEIVSVIDSMNLSLDSRWLSMRLLEGDRLLIKEIDSRFDSLSTRPEIVSALAHARKGLLDKGITPDKLRDMTVTAIMDRAQEIASAVTTRGQSGYSLQDKRLDRILTGKKSAFLIMVLMLVATFWLTIKGANYPSEWLSKTFFFIEDALCDGFKMLNAPEWLCGVLIHGSFRVLAWVVSVMLPPMAIFFPLFALLEDSGYLPRIAYNLDRPFKACGACGKQALTMCMGFGCNAVGVVGCRIIDSPRERLLAMLTNSLVPCNGRFPAMITLVTAFFVITGGVGASVLPSLLMTAVILLGVFATMVATKVLSKTLLRGQSSFFALEMPSYRKPRIISVIVRSWFDRTLSVLMRAIIVSAPAGALIWVMANVTIEGQSLIMLCSSALDPLARLMGLDGVILMAFILALPANEIVLPIILMTYSAGSGLPTLAGVEGIRLLLEANGWNGVTALCFVIFSLMHWPCSTTILTIHKETGSLKWTAVAVILPTVMGFAACVAVNLLAKLTGF